MNDIQNVTGLVDQNAQQYVSVISQYKWDIIPDSQLHAAKQALTKNPFIMKTAANDPEAVHTALIQAATLGLDLTEGKRQGWLLPRKNQFGKTVIQLQVGYKGVEAIHQRMGVIDRLTARIVRQNDIFSWSGDDQEKPAHQPSTDGEIPNHFATAEERGPIVGAFAVTYFKDQSILVITTPISVIYEKHRNRSDSWNSYQRKLKAGEKAFPPPWATDEEEMVKKTMAFISSKQWPANIRDSEHSSKILETLHEIDVSDYSLRYTVEQKDAFHNFIEAEDGLGLHLFIERVGTEVYLALHGDYIKAIPRGGKGKIRKKINDLDNQGREAMRNIQNAIEKNDTALLIENMDGALVVTEKMVLATLDAMQRAEYIMMMEGNNELLESKPTEAEQGESIANEVIKDSQS